MKYVMTLLCWCLAMQSLAQPNSACSSLTAAGNREYPPYLWSTPNAPMQGAVALFLQRVSEAIELPIILQDRGPWGRTQEEVFSGRVDMFAGAFFTPARAQRVDYLYPAMVPTRTSVWVRNDSDLAFESLSDLKRLRGVTVINNSFGQEIDDYIRHHLTMHKVTGIEQGFHMLHEGRVDYLIYEEAPGAAYAHQLGYDSLRSFSQSISSEPLYLALSKQSPCNNNALRQRVEAVLVQAEQENWMRDIMEQASQQWRSER